MISFFTIPKPFVDEHTSRSQINAIGSWKHAFPDAEILVFGDEPGIAEATQKLGVRHVPHIDRNDLGTPLLSSAFQSAEALATHRILCYLN
ncbi:MAG TPA: glycosyl transferase family 2, partial [Thermoanaerobaculia bacterium]|nr:glycosyl transferase family 2 [Thermoanaerobaculia bacterium]